MDYISPIGVLRIEISDRGLRSIKFLDKAAAEPKALRSEGAKNCIELCSSALNSYFAKQWGTFNQIRLKIPLDLKGTEFQKKVWGVIYSLPNTYPISGISYSQLAYFAGKPRAIRACANACGQNSIPIIIPCHRIIAANGKLGGYSSGLSRKSWLIWHEGLETNDPRTRTLLQLPPQTR